MLRRFLEIVGLRKHAVVEVDWAKRIAAALEKQLGTVSVEERLRDGTRVDIMTDKYAIEVDWAPKWAEGIGQALYYAACTDRQPCVLLLCENIGHKRFVSRTVLVQTATHPRFAIWTFDVGTQTLHMENGDTLRVP